MSRRPPNTAVYDQPTLPLAGTAGVPAIDPRQELLDLAGITKEEQARAVRLAWDKRLAKLHATDTQYFSKDGVVTDQRTTESHAVQLKAAEAIDAVVGLKARDTAPKVTIQHTINWPAWFTPDNQPTTLTITASPSDSGDVEEESPNE